MCEYCESGEEVQERHSKRYAHCDILKKTVRIQKGGIGRNTSGIEIPIKYCPMCGKDSRLN